MGLSFFIMQKINRAFLAIKHRRLFKKEFAEFKAMASENTRFPVRWEDRIPIFHERTQTTAFDAAYIYHTAWATRVLARSKPQRHVDISSSLFFSVMLSAFIPVDFYDYRPAQLQLTNLTSGSQDLTAMTFGDDSIHSLSCMHVVEHIGLGRYGDPLDANGDFKASSELKRVLAPGGLLLFVVPAGKPRVCFNAHRVYGHAQVLKMFEGLTLESFALLPDDYSHGLVENATADLVEQQSYGCGCYAFRKPE